ncbi:MAG: protease modulator HflC [Acidobacteriota bacterium]
MKGLVPVVIVVVVLAVLLGGSVFIVDQTQQAIITQFGRPVGGAIENPGVHLKIPFIQTVHFFEKRFLEWNGDPNQVPTKDKRFILVDTYARWRIVDPLLFFQRLRDERGALTRLDDIIDGETRNAVAGTDVLQVIRSTNREVQIDPELAADEQMTTLAKITTGRMDLMTQILKHSQERTSDLGIEILDIRFKRINYNQDVRKTVFQRMIAERKRIADRFRSEGLGESARIRGEKERKLKEIQSGAYRSAQEIIGRADAKATSIYAGAYGQDPDFYAFFKTLETYRSALDENSWLIMTTNSDFFQFLQKQKGGKP